MMPSLLEPSVGPFMRSQSIGGRGRRLDVMPSVTDSLTAPATPQPAMKWSEPAPPLTAPPNPAVTGGNGGVQRYADDNAGPGLRFDRDLPITLHPLTRPDLSALGWHASSVGDSGIPYGDAEGPLSLDVTSVPLETAAVPEPASAALVGVAFVLLLRRGRRERRST
jgi:hypothetical protein